MIFDRVAVQGLASGRLPLTPSSKKEAVASFLVVGKDGDKADKPLAEKPTPGKESAVLLLTKSPASRASTSPTVNESQSITPLSEYSPNGDSVGATMEPIGEKQQAAADGDVSKFLGQNPDEDDKEPPLASSESRNFTDDTKEAFVSEARDITQDRVDDVFMKLEADGRAKFANDQAPFEPARSNTCKREMGMDDDFTLVKVRHNEQVRLIPINSKADDIGSATKELALLLRAAFGVSQQQEVVGLVASAGADTDQPQIVAPLSAIVSGRLVQEEGSGIREFELLTQAAAVRDEERSAEAPHSIDEHFLSQDIDSSGDVSGDEASTDSESDGFVSVALFSHIIRQLVKENELDAAHGESLQSFIKQKYGRDGTVTGPLQVAHFVFSLHERIDLFCNALNTIAEATIRESFSDGEYDEEEAVLQLSSMEHLLDVAEFLHSSNDISTPSYLALCQAILESNHHVTSVYSSYRICLEQDFDEDASSSLEGLEGTPSTHSLDYLLFAIRDLAENLEPLEVCPDLPQCEGRPTLLTWAFHMGTRSLPQRARDDLYELFRDGDDNIMTALRLFLLDNDIDALEDAVLSRLKILHQGDEMDKFEGDDAPLVQESADAILEDVPDTILAAVTVLVEHERISKDAAAALTSSFSLGNSALELVHEKFIDNGNAEEFLDAMEELVSDFPCTKKTGPDTLVSKLDEKENIEPVSNDNPGPSGDMVVAKTPVSRSVLFEIMKDFDETHVAALRLAVAKEDPLLRCALEQFRDNRDASQFRQALLKIAELEIEETVGPGPDPDSSKQILNERRYGLRLILAYLVEIGKMTSSHGSSLLKRFDDGDDAVHESLRAFEASYDASSFVVRLRSI